MSTLFSPVTRTRLLGNVGLLLMLLVAKLSEPAYAADRTARAGAKAFLARRAIDVVAGIGWATDHVGRRRPASGGRRAPGGQVARPA